MPFDLTLDSGLIILIAAFDLYLVVRFGYPMRGGRLAGQPRQIHLLHRGFQCLHHLRGGLGRRHPQRPFQRGDFVQRHAHPLGQNILL